MSLEDTFDAQRSGDRQSEMTHDELCKLIRATRSERNKLRTILREAHSLLNSHEITFRLPAVPWRDRRNAWNKAVEKVKGGQ